MPIREFLHDNRVFVADDVRVMNEALMAALAKLGLNDRKDPLVEMVARRIVRAALDGERNVIRLSEIGAGGQE
jgi:hypothetical protein